MKLKKIFPLFLIFISGCFPSQKEYVFSGKTMGTTYHIKIVSSHKNPYDSGLKEDIDFVLKEVNKSMSVYDPKSEISKFNHIEKNKELKISKDFFSVLKLGRKIYDITSGSWDATAGPLVNFWGFGPEKIKSDNINDEVNILLQNTGYNNLVLNEQNTSVSKNTPALYLDLGSIAKGYGVDIVSELLITNGYKNFMVEIGGEVFTLGKNKKGQKWQIGINNPIKESGISDIVKVVSISGKAVATSGTYRNYVKKNNGYISHIIDPKTGYPAKNNVVSVTVISDNCAFADGLATGFLVMGADKAVDVCNGLENTECMIIEKDGGLKFTYSNGFDKYYSMK